MMATEERINQDLVLVLVASNSQPFVPGNKALVSALSACSIQPSENALVVRPSTPNAVATAGMTAVPPVQDTISTAAQAYPATNVKL